MIAYLTVWDCGCADAQATAQELPEVCPGHQRPRIVDNQGRAVSEIGEPGQDVVLGHDCDTDRPCPKSQGNQ